MPNIQDFLLNTSELKRLIQVTKETDSYYLEKREIPKEYNPKGAYDFNSWREQFTSEIRSRYETLHKDLLYTDEPQDFNNALSTFDSLNQIFIKIEE